MTPTKHRALIALADATDRPFLSAAPLMAIVEAVAVLDEAGLLSESTTTTVVLPTGRGTLELTQRMFAAREEALRLGVEAALEQVSEERLRSDLGVLLEGQGETEAAREMREALDDADAARFVLDDEGFRGRTLEAQVRALVAAWGEARDTATPTPTVAACSSCGAIDGDLHLSGCDRDDPAAPPMQARLIEPPATVPCPKCGEPLNGGQTCLNYPACPNAILPF